MCTLGQSGLVRGVRRWTRSSRALRKKFILRHHPVPVRRRQRPATNTLKTRNATPTATRPPPVRPPQHGVRPTGEPLLPRAQLVCAVVRLHTPPPPSAPFRAVRRPLRTAAARAFAARTPLRLQHRRALLRVRPRSPHRLRPPQAPCRRGVLALLPRVHRDEAGVRARSVGQFIPRAIRARVGRRRPRRAGVS